MTARKLAYDAVLKTVRDKSYSNLTLDALLKESELSPKDKQFASRLFYGIIERKLTLDYQIKVLTKKVVNKLDAEVLVALELGLYQLLYMDSVPDSAAVNESVNIIKKSRKKSASGFVNGVLRNFVRNGKRITLPDDKYEKAEVLYSVPVDILKLWERDYDYDTALLFAKSFLDEKPLNIRINTKVTNSEKLLSILKEKNILAESHPIVPDCIVLKNQGSITSLPGFKEGEFYVQDASSQLCAMAVEPKEGERILDLCAAPGSKSFTMALLSDDKAKISSFDLHNHRVKLISDGAKRLSLDSITAMQGDATKFDPELCNADKVLCDVPCSGLGIIGRKPEIKYKAIEEINNLRDVQLSVLENGSRYLKSGGILIYSTCALNKAENEDVTEEFLRRNPDFERDDLPPVFERITGNKASYLTLSPLSGDFDGFFISRFKKK